MFLLEYSELYEVQRVHRMFCLVALRQMMEQLNIELTLK